MFELELEPFGAMAELEYGSPVYICNQDELYRVVALDREAETVLCVPDVRLWGYLRHHSGPLQFVPRHKLRRRVKDPMGGYDG